MEDRQEKTGGTIVCVRACVCDKKTVGRVDRHDRRTRTTFLVSKRFWAKQGVGLEWGYYPSRFFIRYLAFLSREKARTKRENKKRER